MSWQLALVPLALLSALVLVLSTWAWEAIALRRLANARDEVAIRAAAARLSAPARGAAEALAEALEAEAPIEPILVAAARDLARAPFRARLSASLDVALVVVGSAPLAAALLSAPERILAAERSLETLPRAQLLVEASERLAPAFEALAQGLALGGASLAAVGLVWILRGWLASPAAREARHLEALYRAAVRLAPNAPAPVAGRLAEALAPPTDLTRPVLAAVFWVIALTVSWAALVSTGPLRERRARPMALDLWPEGREQPVEVPPGLRLPTGPGGDPVDEGLKLLTISPSAARLGSAFLFDGTSGVWPDDWRAQTRSRLSAAGAIAGHRVLVAAHEDLSASAILDLLGFLSEQVDELELELLLARGRPALQATLLARIGPPPPGALRAVLGEAARVVVDGLVLPPSALAEHLRSREHPVLALMPGEGLAWGDVVRVIGAVDDSCPAGAMACRQPGLGVRTVFPSALGEARGD